jgi:hypothetical protein
VPNSAWYWFFCLLVGISFYFPAVAAVKRDRSNVYAQNNLAAADDSRTNKKTGIVGDAACFPCHQEQSVSYRRTSHCLSSQPAQADSILGSFSNGSNILMISNPEKTSLDPRLYFRMEVRDGGYYETAVAERASQVLTRSERIDVVIGSGRRGQTYLYWKGEQLYELPVSYWTDGHQWINSPGYKDGTANFARHVDPRCLECHTTYVRALSADPQTNLYDRASLVTGISCESCHGPGADHIAKETRASAKLAGSAVHSISNPANFSRDRQIDQCALCHNGTQRQQLLPSFSYVPGMPLDEYLAPNPQDTVDHPDVHGNQVGLLKRSRCYLSSASMTCSTCHNVHAPERSAASYSDRCLNCHKWQSCGVAKTMGVKIADNCIDCHMPLQQTDAIVSTTADKMVRTSIRTHWIKVYPGVEPR